MWLSGRSVSGGVLKESGSAAGWVLEVRDPPKLPAGIVAAWVGIFLAGGIISEDLGRADA